MEASLEDGTASVCTSLVTAITTGAESSVDVDGCTSADGEHCTGGVVAGIALCVSTEGLSGTGTTDALSIGVDIEDRGLGGSSDGGWIANRDCNVAVNAGSCQGGEGE